MRFGQRAAYALTAVILLGRVACGMVMLERGRNTGRDTTRPHHPVPTRNDSPAIHSGICVTVPGTSVTRRNLLAAFAVGGLSVAAPADPARAVKPRNEALCDTGLFENFLEYRCTPVGNIEDEGIGKKLSATEEAAADSLMSKLLLNVEEDRAPSKNDRTTNNKQSEDILEPTARNNLTTMSTTSKR